MTCQRSIGSSDVPCAMRRVTVVATLVAAWGCLENGIPEASRRNLVLGEVEFPVGLWVNRWASGYAMAELVRIIIEEVLGLNVEVKGEGQSSTDAFYAVAGCTTPTDLTDRGCGADRSYVHVNVEAWEGGYADLLASMRATMPTAPKTLGSMGYSGTTSMYIGSDLRGMAYEAEGLSLDFYRDYNTSWRNVSKYFISPKAVNTSRLLPCSKTMLQESSLMEHYLAFTGDEEGVVRDGEFTRGKCFDGFFWYPPSCRNEPSGCANIFTGGTGWSISEIMQKAAAFNAPIAVSVAATYSDFTSLPEDYPAILYWWVPDPTFLKMEPHQVVFPPFDPAAWHKGDLRTQQQESSVEKHVSTDLRQLAPDVEAMLSNLRITLAMVNSILVDWLDSDATWREVSCRWLQRNTEVWRSWIPNNSECFRGFGMYHQREGRFVSDSSDPTFIDCRVCPAGRFSEQLQIGTSVTYICKECPAGSFQASAASDQCQPCPVGEFQDRSGQGSCQRCVMGRYQDQLGQVMCKNCPAGTDTVGFASQSIADCGCRENTINTDGNTNTFNCVACGKGLRCPFSSSVASLREGQAELGDEYVPEVLSGYFSSQEAPLILWECKPSSRCPGGKPGTCRGGLLGWPCSRCPVGESNVAGVCTACPSGTHLVLSLAVVVSLFGLVAAYYLTNQGISAQLTPFKAMTLSVILAINVLQGIAIFGMMTLQWSDDFQEASGALRVLMLDLERLQVSCIVGSAPINIYLLSASLCPAALLWLLLVYFVSKLCSRPWRGHWLLSTMGKLLQAGFGAMSALALEPLMCYSHPNGQRSLLQYNDVVCGTDEHLVLSVIGALLGSLVLGFFAACIYAAWALPSWSSHGQKRRVWALRFLYAAWPCLAMHSNA